MEVSSLGNGRGKSQQLSAGVYFILVSGPLHLPFQFLFLLCGHKLPYLKSVRLVAFESSHSHSQELWEMPIQQLTTMAAWDHPLPALQQRRKLQLREVTGLL